jgi:soluble P-type ATPase
MLELDVPGYKKLRLENIVLDFNGTVSCDGRLLPGVSERLLELKGQFTVYVITADTFGTVREQVGELAEVRVLKTDDHREEKRSFVAQLGAGTVVAFGNGRNDVMMLKEASLGIAVCQREGAAGETFQAADIVCTDILDGLDLLRFPKRLLATLRA